MARRRNSARSPRYLAAARVVSQALRDRGTVAVVYLPFPTGGLRLMITTSNILGCVSPFKQYAFAID